MLPPRKRNVRPVDRIDRIKRLRGQACKGQLFQATGQAAGWGSEIIGQTGRSSERRLPLPIPGCASVWWKAIPTLAAAPPHRHQVVCPPRPLQRDRHHRRTGLKGRGVSLKTAGEISQANPGRTSGKIASQYLVSAFDVAVVVVAIASAGAALPPLAPCRTRHQIVATNSEPWAVIVSWHASASRLQADKRALAMAGIPRAGKVGVLISHRGTVSQVGRQEHSLRADSKR